MAYISSWKSRFWDVDPESGKHDFKLKPRPYENINDSSRGDKYMIWVCQKCGSEIGSYGPEKPSPGWGPHCLEVILKDVVE